MFCGEEIEAAAFLKEMRTARENVKRECPHQGGCPSGRTSSFLSGFSGFLYNLILCHVYRERISTFYILAFCDGHILISHGIFYAGPGFYHRILHEHTVLYPGAHSYLHTAEQDAVFHLALDDASIGSHDIDGL